MPKFGKIRFRRRQVRKVAWIALTGFSALAMVLGMFAPYLNNK